MDLYKKYSGIITYMMSVMGVTKTLGVFNQVVSHIQGVIWPVRRISVH